MKKVGSLGLMKIWNEDHVLIANNYDIEDSTSQDSALQDVPDHQSSVRFRVQSVEESDYNGLEEYWGWIGYWKLLWNFGQSSLHSLSLQTWMDLSSDV